MTSPRFAPVLSVPLVHRGPETTPAAADGPVRLPAPRRILLATSGQPSCEHAARAAAMLARVHGAAVTVVSVFTPPVGYPGGTGAAPPAILPSDRPAADAQLQAVKQQVAPLAPADAQWPVELTVGHIGPRIAEAATRTHADLVVIGNGRAKPGERALGDRGAIDIAACVNVPVLAVGSEGGHPARRVMFAVGLDECSLHAVKQAVAILPEPEAAMLAHARPRHGVAAAERDEDPRDVAQRIDAVRHVLSPWPNARVDVVMLSGDPLQALLALARQRDTDLIVGGLNGETYDERAHARNLTLQLLAAAECSVLLLPIARSAASPPPGDAAPPTS